MLNFAYEITEAALPAQVIVQATGGMC